MTNDVNRLRSYSNAIKANAPRSSDTILTSPQLQMGTTSEFRSAAKTDDSTIKKILPFLPDKKEQVKQSKEIQQNSRAHVNELKRTNTQMISLNKIMSQQVVLSSQILYALKSIQKMSSATAAASGASPAAVAGAGSTSSGGGIFGMVAGGVLAAGAAIMGGKAIANSINPQASEANVQTPGFFPESGPRGAQPPRLRDGSSGSPHYGKPYASTNQTGNPDTDNTVDASKVGKLYTNPNSSSSQLSEINPNQLKFLRAIGSTESNWNKNEAYSEKYNQPHNNANVRRIGEDGADYGYFQNNGQQVKEAIKKYNMDPEVAKHLHGGGKGGMSTPEQQTYAMHQYLKKRWPELYEGVKSGDPVAIDKAAEAMKGTWFGIKDRWNSSETQAVLRGKTTPGMAGVPELGKNTNAKTLENAKSYLENQLKTAPEADKPKIQQQIEDIGKLQTQLQQQKSDKPQVNSTNSEIPPVGDTSKAQYNRISGTGAHPSQESRNILPVETAFGKTRLHKSSAAAFQGFFDEMKNAGAPINKLGSYNVRQKRWSNGWSEHSFGNAVDIDDAVHFSPELKKWMQDNPGKFEELKKKWGMKQGMAYDPAHVEFGGKVTAEAQQELLKRQQKLFGKAEIPEPPKKPDATRHADDWDQTKSAVQADIKSGVRNPDGTLNHNRSNETKSFASPVPLQAPSTAEATPNATPVTPPSVAPPTQQLNDQAVREKATPPAAAPAPTPAEPPRADPAIRETKSESESKDQFFDSKSSQNGWAPSVMNYWKQGKEGINV